MRLKRFGQFLINSGAVNKEDIYDALNMQRKKTFIGRIAIKKKLLTINQVYTIS